MKALRLVFVAVAFGVAACAPDEGKEYNEHSVATLQALMARGELTSRELVEYYLERIRTFDRGGPALRSIIETNPDALRIAGELDAERAANRVRGPLHGIPVVLKANIDTGDEMATTAGSLALQGHRAPDDAFHVARLREAGAIILAKANLSEWANFRSSQSSSGWSSLGGQTKNPYDALRNPCGSSSGSAVAVTANLTTLAVGTETDGSVICPSGINGIVGIKPTLGLVSRDGIIPIAPSQDTAGPMARSVRDAALLLSVMAARDDNDPASGDRPELELDFAADLSLDAIADKRIGVIRSYYGAGEHPAVEAIFADVISLLGDRGAEIIDPIELDTGGVGVAEGEVLKYEFKENLNRYLRESGAPVRSLAEVITFNIANRGRVMPLFGQNILIESQDKGPLSDDVYLRALEDSKRISQNAIDSVMDEHQLDALIAPSNGPAWMTDHVNGDSFHVGSSSYAAVSGYANVTVPAGFVAGLPIGVSFIGGPFSEKTLIGIAYAFEQASKARKPPDFH